ncbi:MAG: hypothetical protein HFJ50_02135 [Clostridia bacterium]|jgi:hypothetical protein|nr:hypothetical protein [Clostridia bacterium]
MRICFIVGAFPKMKCGVGDYTYKLAEELSKNNIDVHVITSKKAEKLDDKYMHVYNEIEEWDKSRSKENNQKIKRD